MSPRKVSMEDMMSGFSANMNRLLGQQSKNVPTTNSISMMNQQNQILESVMNPFNESDNQPKDEVIKADDTLTLDNVKEFLDERVGKEIIISFGKKTENLVTLFHKDILKKVSMSADSLMIMLNCGGKIYINKSKFKSIQLGKVKTKIAYLIRGYENMSDVMIRG